MIWQGIAYAGALVAAAPQTVAAPSAQSVAPISLVPGEAVTLRFDDGDVAVGAPERGTAAWSRFDVVAARQLTGTTPPDAPVPVGTPMHSDEASPDPIPSGEVHIRFLSIAGRHSMLVVENGQGRALRYRARMTVGGRTHATDVCVVLPHLPSYEHWPDPVQRLELSDFRFIPWTQGQAPTCE